MNDYKVIKIFIYTYVILSLSVTVYILVNLYANHIINNKSNPIQSEEPVIIWNDDHESIPIAGSLVRIEMIVNDTIYLSPN
jgi:hypothetical protein